MNSLELPFGPVSEELVKAKAIPGLEPIDMVAASAQMRLFPTGFSFDSRSMPMLKGLTVRRLQRMQVPLEFVPGIEVVDPALVGRESSDKVIAFHYVKQGPDGGPEPARRVVALSEIRFGVQAGHRGYEVGADIIPPENPTYYWGGLDIGRIAVDYPLRSAEDFEPVPPTDKSFSWPHIEGLLGSPATDLVFREAYNLH